MQTTSEKQQHQTRQSEQTMITVDYYETMKSTHWDPKFKELACRLTRELIKVNYSRTGMTADLWSLATMNRLHPPATGSLLPSTTNVLLDAFGLTENGTMRGLSNSTVPLSYVHCETVLMSLKHPTPTNNTIITPLFQPASGAPFTGTDPRLYAQVVHTPNENLIINSQPIPRPLTTNEHTNFSTHTPFTPVNLQSSQTNHANSLFKSSLMNLTFGFPNGTTPGTAPLNKNVLPNLPISFATTLIQQLLVSSGQPVCPAEQQMFPHVNLNQTFFSPAAPPTGLLGMSTKPCSWPVPLEPSVSPLFLLQPLASATLDSVATLCTPQVGQISLRQTALPLPKQSQNAELNALHQLRAAMEGLLVTVCRFDVLSSRDEVKTRFMCGVCGRQWTSMKGSVSFVVILSYNRTGPVQVDRWLIQPGANVFFELFSQSCGECDVLCQPKWYPEEVFKVIRNLFVKIHEHFYQSVISWTDRWDCHRRDGHPSGPHDTRKCVACQQGLCRGGLIMHPNAKVKSAGVSGLCTTHSTPQITTPSAAEAVAAADTDQNTVPQLNDSPTNSPSCKRRQIGSLTSKVD